MHHPLSPAWRAEQLYHREVLRASAEHRTRPRLRGLHRRPLRPTPSTPPRA